MRSASQWERHSWWQTAAWAPPPRTQPCGRDRFLSDRLFPPFPEVLTCKTALPSPNLSRDRYQPGHTYPQNTHCFLESTGQPRAASWRDKTNKRGHRGQTTTLALSDENPYKCPIEGKLSSKRDILLTTHCFHISTDPSLDEVMYIHNDMTTRDGLPTYDSVAAAAIDDFVNGRWARTDWGASMHRPIRHFQNGRPMHDHFDAGEGLVRHIRYRLCSGDQSRPIAFVYTLWPLQLHLSLDFFPDKATLFINLEMESGGLWRMQSERMETKLLARLSWFCIHPPT